MLLVGIVLVCWLAGFAVLWRAPFCRPSPVLQQPPCRFAIVIPARNEEANLPALLASIAGQSTQPSQVIVVDDHSTDSTAEIAKANGATVLSSADLPEGWRGKTWACHQGALAADADHLMFIDADITFEPGGLRLILDEYTRGNPNANNQTPALSVSPYHRTSRPHEQLSAFFNLVMTAGIGAFALWPRESDGLFGQMLLVSRQAYDRAGGHAQVKGKILENLYLARHFRASGTPVRCRLGKGALSVRMYPDSLGSLIEGWTKGFASGSKATAPAVLLAIIAWLSGAASATTLALKVQPAIALAVYALYALQIYVLLRRIGAFKLYTAVLFPLPLVFFFAVFARSALRSRRSVTWKGRVIHAD